MYEKQNIADDKKKPEEDDEKKKGLFNNKKEKKKKDPQDAGFGGLQNIEYVEDPR
jgi:hypothetical protein